jgi:hypothetical protein
MTSDTKRAPTLSSMPGNEQLIGVSDDAGELDRPPPPSGFPRGLCPFLATPSGSWRAAFPTHEHECSAVIPPVPLALEKQRRLCLVAYHETCATYRAALAERTRLGVGGESGSNAAGRAGGRSLPQSWAGRPFARTTPVLLERPRPGLGLSASAGRSAGQLVLVALVVIAFILIALARLGTPGSPAAAPGAPSVGAPSGYQPADAPSGYQRWQPRQYDVIFPPGLISVIRVPQRGQGWPPLS